MWMRFVQSACWVAALCSDEDSSSADASVANLYRPYACVGSMRHDGVHGCMNMMARNDT
jgi:hypothetical protein